MQKSVYKKFLFRLIIFFAVLVLIDRGLGLAFKKIYFAQRVGQFSQTTYAVDSAKQDIIIFGSSRAVRDYSSPIISNITGLSCYNSGRDGLMIPYCAAVEDVTLKRCRPKLLILDIAPRELGTDKIKYERLTILLPYCQQHKELVKYISQASRFEKYKLFSKTYPYNSSLFILATNSLFPGSEKKDENGYLPLDGAMDKAKMDDYLERMTQRYATIRNKPEIAEKAAVGYYRQFLDSAAAKGVKTLVIISPTLLKDPFYLDNQTIEKNIVANVANAYPNVTFLDFSSDPRFNYHPEKFADVFHLNKKGSEEFSAILGRYITDHQLAKANDQLAAVKTN